MPKQTGPSRFEPLVSDPDSGATGAHAHRLGVLPVAVFATTGDDFRVDHSRSGQVGADGIGQVRPAFNISPEVGE